MELTMSYWATPAMDRNQIVMFAPTLDAMVSDDHPARLFDEILCRMDWSSWEARYCLDRGQPPIHPRVLAGILLYGMSLGLRSSRILERACGVQIDFMWLASGEKPDHSTLCQFRTRFRAELKDLFKQIGRIAMNMGLIRLNQVGLDGTRVLASSSRHGTRSAQSIENSLAELEPQIERMLKECEDADRKDQELFGAASTELPRELKDLQRRKAALDKALKKAREMDARRQERNDAPKKAAKVPLTDGDSAVLPNKEGGYAPNYTPMAAVDGQRGFIVDVDCHAETFESHTTVATVERIEETFGQRPSQLLADGAHGTGQNLTKLAAAGVDAYIPVVNDSVVDGPNPAVRDDLTRPVAQDQWDKLPRNAQSKKLDKSAFIYVEAEDCYYCPMGRKLNYLRDSMQQRRQEAVTYRQYQCAGCDDCPLAGACKGKGARSVSRDEHEQVRQAMSAKLRCEAGRQTYGRRKWICETVFGMAKGALGFRRFLLRGLEKVQTEWTWLCTAMNLRKLARETARIRGQLAAMVA
jgi:transposase